MKQYYRFMNKITLEYYDVPADKVENQFYAMLRLRDYSVKGYEFRTQWSYKGIVEH